MKKYITLCATMLLLMGTACDHNRFHVDGEIAGASDKAYAIEYAENGVWVVLDSVHTDSKGKFSYAHDKNAYPQIYRLTSDAGKHSIFFAVEGAETIKIDAKDSLFTQYSLTGNDLSISMQMIDAQANVLSQSVSSADYQSKVADFRKGLVQKVISDPSSLLSYYIINKTIGSEPIFSPDNKEDVRVLGAVANAYHEKKPDDPRTKLLVAMFMQARRSSGKLPMDTLKASQTSLLDIALPDENGQTKSLSALARSHRTILLNFTSYEDKQSPAFNKALFSLYTRYKDQGLDIYQVCLDGDISTWKISATNIPWTTVYEEAGISSQHLLNYNVSEIPTSFIIRSAEIVARISNPNDTEKTVNQWMAK